jgi:hypothetical protein
VILEPRTSKGGLSVPSFCRKLVKCSSLVVRMVNLVSTRRILLYASKSDQSLLPIHGWLIPYN